MSLYLCILQKTVLNIRYGFMTGRSTVAFDNYHPNLVLFRSDASELTLIRLS